MLEFLEQLVLGQYNALDMMRPVLFSFLRDHRVEEDIEQKLQVLVALTENGKDIVHIEEQVGPFLLESLETVVGRGGGGEAEQTTVASTRPVVPLLLQFTANTVTFNSAYLSQNVVVQLIGKHKTFNR